MTIYGIPFSYFSLLLQMTQQQSRQIEPGVYESRFHVPQDLVGLAIGRDGNNVNEARRLNGVLSIEYDDYSHRFIVKGEVSGVSVNVCVSVAVLCECKCVWLFKCGSQKK